MKDLLKLITCGKVESPLDTQEAAIAQSFTVTRAMRERRNGHRALTVWFTGLSGAGKSTLANELEKRLFASGVHTMVLDGDNVRLGLNRGLAFSSEDRRENIRRAAEAAKLLNTAGVVVLACFISPFAADRAMAREILGDCFVEVYVSTDLSTCEGRDVKGLYAKARRGEIRQFTGISSPYEPPEAPEITVDTGSTALADCVETVLEGLKRRLGNETEL